ncbi:SDR family oxidoreductase [Haliea sp. AH-315-K21]|uniref:NAD-dependent dehydratase n=1 Tax=SAR86 cluster bacterium TaxID=2030880 RepID=A0A2A5CAN8_9GAMM|nr:SDR family oxidoreductase [Haliea sp. AH-315-K21]MBN4075782.1 SDR family oxidoreductase [Gammaproteobacteria bacterium AH-315-E17]PCJ40426.1 MAG: NAD-dependent dehydratase [SAR86 cluster bacterium]
MRVYGVQKKVLVTGGCGFLGSHLVDKLIERGDYVIAVDNLYTGSRQNTLQHESNPNFEFLRHDIEVDLTLEVDEIYNLACPASPVHYQHDPIKTVKTCILGAINMLNLAKRLEAKIFQASTSEVYGDPAVHPQSESYFGNVNPIGIRSCYDEGKRVSETLFFDYHRKENIDIRVARIFNTYGPRMHPNDGRVVSNFIVQALQGKDLTIYGDGGQTRSFCYVDDLIDGFLKFMDLTPNGDGESVYPGPLNLGNPQEFTILELAHLVISMTGSSSKIISLPLPSDDPMQRRPDITLAQDCLDDWHPGIPLEDGLRKTIEYFDHLLVNI